MKNGINKKANPESLSGRRVLWYDPRLTERARELRKSPTRAEEVLWKRLLSLRPHECKFLRQKPIGYYILDFYCSRLLLGIELDGEIHEQNKAYDAERDEYLKSCGITIVRFRNKEILESWEKVKSEIEKTIGQIISNKK